MTTNPTPTIRTVRPTGAVVARAHGFDTAASAAWFTFAGHATFGKTACATYKAHGADKAIATYHHRRPGEDVPH